MTWSLAEARTAICARASSVILYSPPNRMACRLGHLVVEQPKAPLNDERAEQPSAEIKYAPLGEGEDGLVTDGLALV
jgi:hypothetical protein